MTVHRYIEALYIAGVLTDTVTPRIEEKYFKVLSKYLLGKKESSGEANA